jgi:hypothetical protein
MSKPQKTPSLYKYLEEKYAVKMLQEGNIRIGSLYEYRTHWNDQIRDEEEGKVSSNQYVPHYSPRSGEPVPEMAKEAINLPDYSKLNLKNVYFEKAQELSNGNIYCTTLEASEAVMKEFNSEACIEIINITKFNNIILKKLMKEGLSNGNAVLLPCTYEGRLLRHEELIRPVELPYYYLNTIDKLNRLKKGMAMGVEAGYFTKRAFYAPQKEMRLLIEPKDEKQVIEPIIINVPGIIPYIKRRFF